jgi:CheY-like chemotaxis protein
MKRGVMRDEQPSPESKTSHGLDETYVADWHTKAARIDQLLLKMSYEIRTTVNLILGLTDVMQELELSSDLSSNIGAMRMSAEHLLQGSECLTDLTRAELGSLQLCPASFNVAGVLQSVIELVSVQTVCKRIRLRSHISHDIPAFVVGDSARLSQMLIALLCATVDRLAEGEITVTVEYDSRNTEGTKIRFSVADNAPNDCSEPEERPLDGSLDSKSSVGIRSENALLLAIHLARMMGGDLWTEVHPKMGSTINFNVNLPAAATVDCLQACEAGTDVLVGQRRLKILVADDSTDSLRLIRAFLKDVPWRIESANNGRTAVDMAVSKSYDLILMDIDMPEMDGYFATRQIRISECLNETPAVPIVALTAHNEAEVTAKSIQAGCTTHIAKPIRRAVLIETIQRYAGDRRRSLLLH